MLFHSLSYVCILLPTITYLLTHFFFVLLYTFNYFFFILVYTFAYLCMFSSIMGIMYLMYLYVFACTVMFCHVLCQGLLYIHCCYSSIKLSPSKFCLYNQNDEVNMVSPMSIKRCVSVLVFLLLNCSIQPD